MKYVYVAAFVIGIALGAFFITRPHNAWVQCNDANACVDFITEG